MIDLTREYARRSNLSFPTERLSWVELPSKFRDEFDMIFCVGNSISHSLNSDEMLSNLMALYNVLKNKGRLIIDTRNWDKMINNYKRFETSEIKYYNNKKYVCTYIWNLLEHDKNSFVEILFIDITDNKDTDCIPIRLDFVPFSHEEFINRLISCGFKIQFDSFQRESDFYHLIVEK